MDANFQNGILRIRDLIQISIFIRVPSRPFAVGRRVEERAEDVPGCEGHGLHRVTGDFRRHFRLTRISGLRVAGGFGFLRTVLRDAAVAQG
jgi:hypothetical protein